MKNMKNLAQFWALASVMGSQHSTREVYTKRELTAEEKKTKLDNVNKSKGLKEFHFNVHGNLCQERYSVFSTWSINEKNARKKFNKTQ